MRHLSMEEYRSIGDLDGVGIKTDSQGTTVKGHQTKVCIYGTRSTSDEVPTMNQSQYRL
ncbi:hypothetical protein DPMN_161052 [Dreissena polymorpha]|uniref:Uncharacterized protein n=1 Tax=Dreissena polymorpha TaxID=45954 RepID=A0A9D4IS84_DREPO|nr:hypothetical protein DPMN_161052 [Dreissena polymorpha]